MIERLTWEHRHCACVRDRKTILQNNSPAKGPWNIRFFEWLWGVKLHFLQQDPSICDCQLLLWLSPNLTGLFWTFKSGLPPVSCAVSLIIQMSSDKQALTCVKVVAMLCLEVNIKVLSFVWGTVTVHGQDWPSLSGLGWSELRCSSWRGRFQICVSTLIFYSRAWNHASEFSTVIAKILRQSLRCFSGIVMVQNGVMLLVFLIR